MNRLILLLLIVTCHVSDALVAEDLNCLTPDELESAALYTQLQQQAYEHLDRRTEAYERLKTPADIRNHQTKLRDFFIKQLGGFPERSPLNSKTVRTIAADGYRIECVMFESLPDHHITANLYLPDGGRPVPGVVVSSGHSRTAKTADYNQRFGIMMAKQGMAALCFDPIGQGERSQVLDEQGEPYLGTTTEHLLIGFGSTLVGRSTARYRVWDAMRAIDYMISRPEIDAQRIGFTGCSGGGTLTSYVMALDDRVACAAPACYLTTFRRLIETIGPQDAEQNVFGQIAFGLDHPDYVLLRAPRPTLISSTTGDFFDIQGSWDNFRQAKRIYARLGYPERVDLVEVEGSHGVAPQNLATIAHWMRRWLLGRDESVQAIELATRPPAELLCTQSGQVLTSLAGQRSVFDLNAAYESELAQRRTALHRQESAGQVHSEIARLLSIELSGERRLPNHEDRGRVKRDDYHIDKLILRTTSGALLPALTFHPESPAEDAYVYLHDDGKLGDAGLGGPIERRVREGYVVVSLDLRGQGETASGKRDPLLSDWKTYYLGYLLGKPLVGMRVDDLLAARDFVARYEKKDGAARKVHLVAAGQSGIVALHAAALDPSAFASVTLRDTPREWSTLVRQSHPQGHIDSAVHGALTVYDLPDLVRLAGKDKVRFDE
jgi:cephalosporin-C deacetylase-like acetyl esterase